MRIATAISLLRAYGYPFFARLQQPRQPMPVSRRSVLLCLAIPILSWVAGCGDALGPTPTSALVTVTVTTDPVRAQQQTLGAFRIAVPLDITNTSDAPIYFHPLCFAILQRSDKGKWLTVTAAACPDIGIVFTAIDAGATLQVTTNFQPSWGDYFSGATGTYRVRLWKLAFDDEGRNPLPPDAGYSRPFAVTE